MKDNLHQDNMSMKSIPPYIPPLYSKTGVNKGIPILIFDPKIDSNILKI